MKKNVPLFLLLCLFLAFSFFHLPKISSDEMDDISKKIADLTEALNMSKSATAPLESQLKSMQAQIKDIKNRVAFIEKDVETKKKNIDGGYKNLEKQEKILKKTVHDFYVKSYYNSPLLIILSAPSASELTQLLAYQKAATDQDKVIIINIAISIQDLEVKKKNLEDEQTKLTGIKEKLDKQSEELDKIIQGARDYQKTISGQIAELSQKQQELLAKKLGSLNIPKSAYTTQGGCIDDRDIDPGFSPRFALFTYGVPNRTGMNQFGANGRAKTGQSAEQILNSYYANYELKKDYDTGININVEGYGSFNIEDYVKRIYEMPDSFEMEALKAQAVAARSYALAYTNNGQGSICTTQQCQVFKPDPKGGRWEEAVNATRGWVMAQGGNPIKAWFSSTHGGYIFSTSEIGWSSTSWTKHAKDTTSDSINSFDELKNNAYDKDSPWFYCDWGARAGYNKTAWLKSSEIADIVNVILLAKDDSSNSIRDHLYQTDKPHPYGGEVWNEEKVKSELRSRNITPYNSISDLSVSADFGAGRTSSVNISGDGGSQSFSGSEFKDWFNLRAPANINIVGPLYNVERK